MSVSRFDVGVLKALVGDKVFLRGEAYHRDGHVEILAIEGGRVLAQVAGTEDYRTELIAGNKAVGGECSCPAFEDWGFCKHMVAVALAANALTDDAEAKLIGARRRIHEHLRQQGVDDLANRILALAERDADLFHVLSMAAGDNSQPRIGAAGAMRSARLKSRIATSWTARVGSAGLPTSSFKSGYPTNSSDLRGDARRQD